MSSSVAFVVCTKYKKTTYGEPPKKGKKVNTQKKTARTVFFYPAVSSFPFVTLLSSLNCLSFLVPSLSFILLSSLHCLSFLVLLLSELGHFTFVPLGLFLACGLGLMMVFFLFLFFCYLS